MPLLWFRNRATDLGAPLGRDAVVPTFIRLTGGTIGSIFLLLALLGFIYPPLFMDIWAWTLTPLTARIMSGWMIVLGGSIAMASLDFRWSAWQIVIEAVLITSALMLIGAFANKGDFTGRTFFVWVSTLLVTLGVVGTFYVRNARKLGSKIAFRPISNVR